jgi:hypothetical protein
VHLQCHQLRRVSRYVMCDVYVCSNVMRVFVVAAGLGGAAAPGAPATTWGRDAGRGASACGGMAGRGCQERGRTRQAAVTRCRCVGLVWVVVAVVLRWDSSGVEWGGVGVMNVHTMSATFCLCFWVDGWVTRLKRLFLRCVVMN